jgi:hypothetical protein
MPHCRIPALMAGLVATTALTACGGSPDPLAGPSPVPGVSRAHLAEALDTYVDETKAVSSMVSVGHHDDDQYGQASERFDANLVFRNDHADEELRTDGDPVPHVEITMDSDNDGAFSQSDRTHYTILHDDSLSEDGIVKESFNATSGYGQTRYTVGKHFFYIPSEGSASRVGAIGHSDDHSKGIYAVYGKSAPASAISEATGTATFEGFAEASAEVNDTASDTMDYDVMRPERGGAYRGTSQGRVNFSDNSVVVDAQLTNGSNNTMTVGLSGTLSADGSISGTSIVGGLRDDEDSVSGDFRANLFGEKAKDLGGTFVAGTGDVNAEDGPGVAVGGMVIMSQTGSE